MRGWRRLKLLDPLDDSRAASYYNALCNVMKGKAMAGRKPLGTKAMTPAERQARFRAAHADGAPKVRYRRPGDRRSRPQRLARRGGRLNRKRLTTIGRQHARAAKAKIEAIIDGGDDRPPWTEDSKDA